jgi:glycosyltransferase involved in cell wall biosynthesis
MKKFLFYDDKIINILVKDEKPSGGAAVQTYGWVRGLYELGEDIEVLTNTKTDELLKEEGRVLKLIPRYDQEKGVRWLRWIYYRLPYLYKKIKESNPDYLYQSIPGWQSFFIGSICLSLGVKYISRISNDNLLDKRFYRKNSRLHHVFMHLGFKLSYCILCQNEYQYSILKKQYSNKKVIKIGNPIVLKFNSNDSIKKQGEYIAWVGLFQYQKNLGLLYEIASRFCSETFCIAGTAEPKCDEETLSYISKLKKLPNVKFVGFIQRDRLFSFLNKAKFLLNTSHYEGFSNTFLEAMMAKTPLLTSVNVNPDNIVSTFNLGLVYKDFNDLYKQYCSVTNEEYEQMTRNVMSYVNKYHDHKSLSKQLLKSLSS